VGPGYAITKHFLSVIATAVGDVKSHVRTPEVRQFCEPASTLLF